MKYYPTEDTFLNASRGLIKGGEVRNIFGATPDATGIVTTEFRTPWELAIGSGNKDYVFPPSALAMSVTSDIGSTADDGVQILIKGLDANYEEIQEVATIANGVPYVTVPFLRINDMITISGNATGNISAVNTAVTYGYITAGAGRDQKAVFTVPAGHCYYLYRIDAFATDSNGGKAAIFRNFTTNANSVNFRVADTEFAENMNIQRRFPFKYGEKSDIKLQLKSSSGSIAGSIFAEGLLLNEPIGIT